MVPPGLTIRAASAISLRLVLDVAPGVLAPHEVRLGIGQAAVAHVGEHEAGCGRPVPPPRQRERPRSTTVSVASTPVMEATSRKRTRKRIPAPLQQHRSTPRLPRADAGPLRQIHGGLEAPDVDLLAHQELPEVALDPVVDGLHFGETDSFDRFHLPPLRIFSCAPTRDGAKNLRARRRATYDSRHTGGNDLAPGRRCGSNDRAVVSGCQMKRSERRYRAYPSRRRRRRSSSARSVRPAARLSVLPGSGTTRMSASSACPETRCQGPCAGFRGGVPPPCVAE